MKSRRIVRLAVLLPMVALLLTACPPKSPQERVAKQRSLYKATLLGFIVEAEPVPTEPVEESPVDGGEAAAVADGDTLEGEAVEAVEAMAPIRQNVRVDVLLQHDSSEKLPGITLDIEMVDSNQVRKENWRLWVDTAELPKATGTQFVHLLEDVDYEEGDGFSVEVRSYVPPEERSEYREFAEVAD